MVTAVAISALSSVTKGLVQGLEDLEKRGRADHPNYSIIKISQNTEKSPGDLRKLNVTQALVKNHQNTEKTPGEKNMKDQFDTTDP